jgi:hypothetical protein
MPAYKSEVLSSQESQDLIIDIRISQPEITANKQVDKAVYRTIVIVFYYYIILST